MRLPNPIDVLTARNWQRVGATEAFKRMCFAWGVVAVIAWMAFNALVVFGV